MRKSYCVRVLGSLRPLSRSSQPETTVLAATEMNSRQSFRRHVSLLHDTESRFLPKGAGGGDGGRAPGCTGSGARLKFAFEFDGARSENAFETKRKQKHTRIPNYGEQKAFSFDAMLIFG